VEGLKNHKGRTQMGKGHASFADYAFME